MHRNAKASIPEDVAERMSASMFACELTPVPYWAQSCSGVREFQSVSNVEERAVSIRFGLISVDSGNPSNRVEITGANVSMAKS